MINILLPALGILTVIFILGWVVNKKILKFNSRFFFSLSFVLFIYFFYQMRVYNQTCLPEDGCMNEFGLFIVLPVMALIIAVILGLASKMKKDRGPDEFN